MIPKSVSSIGVSAFNYWVSNKQPLVIPDGITSIGNYAFAYWTSNNYPLVIPDSVTNISEGAFAEWRTYNQPLVIPNSVSIELMHLLVISPYVEIHAITPPTLVNTKCI